MVEVQEATIDQEDLPPLEVRKARELAFIREHLAQEHEGSALSALISLQLSGERPTKQAIFARLRAQGRTREQMEAKGWL